LWLGLFATCTLAAQPAHATQRPKYRTSFAVYDLEKKTIKTVFTGDGTWECPSWTRDGKYLISNMGGSLYRIPIEGDRTSAPEKITDRSAPRSDLQSDLFIANLDGSHARRLLIGWLHGWSPDGKYVTFVANDKGDFDLFRVKVDGTGEAQLTTSSAQDDGPHYTSDGNWIYFCSNRSGKWDIWRMPANGAGLDDKLAERVASTTAQDWFPHVSPDRKWLYAIAYPPDQPAISSSERM